MRKKFQIRQFSKYTLSSAKKLLSNADFLARYGSDKNTPEPYYIYEKSLGSQRNVATNFDLIPEIEFD